jgi:hypothetical protein
MRNDALTRNFIQSGRKVAGERPANRKEDFIARNPICRDHKYANVAVAIFFLRALESDFK